MPKVSIIIPVYNVEKYLRQCLDSVVNQTLKDIEIICVNDCSPDNSLSILQEYSHNDERIKIIDLKKNRGQGIGRNLGIDQSKGEYIAFVDPDDWVEFDMYEKMYNQAKNLSSDIVIVEYKKYYESTKLYSKSNFVHKCVSCNKAKYFNLPVNRNINKKNIEDILLVAPHYSCNRIYRTDFIKSNNIIFSDVRYYEDVMFVLRSHLESSKISYINEELYNYRIHEFSTLRNNKANNLLVLPQIILAVYNYLEKENYEKIIKENLQYFIYTSCIVCNREVSLIDKIRYFNSIKKYIEPQNKKIFLKDLFIQELNKIFKLLFSIRNEYVNNKKYKYVTILGIKIKLMRLKNG